MRKLLIAALAIAAVFAAGSAWRSRPTVYTVHKARTTAKGKGCKAKPIPTGIKFGFLVEEDSSKRGTVIEKYAIGSEGSSPTPSASRSATSTT